MRFWDGMMGENCENPLISAHFLLFEQGRGVGRGGKWGRIEAGFWGRYGWFWGDLGERRWGVVCWDVGIGMARWLRCEHGG